MLRLTGAILVIMYHLVEFSIFLACTLWWGLCWLCKQIIPLLRMLPEVDKRKIEKRPVIEPEYTNAPAAQNTGGRFETYEASKNQTVQIEGVGNLTLRTDQLRQCIVRKLTITNELISAHLNLQVLVLDDLPLPTNFIGESLHQHIREQSCSDVERVLNEKIEEANQLGKRVRDASAEKTKPTIPNPSAQQSMSTIPKMVGAMKAIETPTIEVKQTLEPVEIPKPKKVQLPPDLNNNQVRRVYTGVFQGAGFQMRNDGSKDSGNGKGRKFLHYGIDILDANAQYAPRRVWGNDLERCIDEIRPKLVKGEQIRIIDRGKTKVLVEDEWVDKYIFSIQREDKGYA